MASLSFPPRASEIGARSTRRGRLAFGLAVASCLLGSFLARLAGAADAFVGRELVTLDGDSLYHLRRMRLVADGFPAVPWIDPMIAWPDGAPIPWAGGFDLLGAAVMLLGRAVGGVAAGDLWVASLCPILGVAVVGATMELAHALRAPAPGARGAALGAGILAGALPQGLAISRFGVIDHHVAEALAMVLLARWAIAALPGRAEGRARRVAHELAGAVLGAGAVAVFTGSPLYVALVLPLLVGAALASPRPTLAGSGGPGLVAAGVAAAWATAPAVAAQGRTYAFGFPSFLQPLLLAVAGVAVCAAVLVGARARPGPRRIAGFLAVAAGGVAVAAVAAQGAAVQTIAAVREWLLKADPWLRGIDEFRPALRHPAGPAAGVNRFLGVVGFAAPLLLPLSALGARPAGRARAAGFAWMTGTLGILWLQQARFGRVFAPFLAATAALALAWLGARFAARVPLAELAPVGVALAVALLDPRVRAAMAVTDPVPDAAIEAALDLRARAPGPAPGVLAPWDLGNAFLVVAGRPVVATGFGPYPDAAAYWEGVKAYTVAEGELLPWLAGRRVGWVVAGAANLFARVSGPGAPLPFSGTDYSPRWFREVASAPLLIGASGIPELGVAHFEHLLPVFASTRRVLGVHAPPPVLWTYEVVPGARLTGRAPPGAKIVLEIPLEEHGHEHRWRAAATADADGAWAITVPLPTDLSTPTLRTREGTLAVGGSRRPVTIREAAVRAGASVQIAAPPPER